MIDPIKALDAYREAFGQEEFDKIDSRLIEVDVQRYLPELLEQAVERGEPLTVDELGLADDVPRRATI